MSHLEACQQVCVWTDQRKPEIACCVRYSNLTLPPKMVSRWCFPEAVESLTVPRSRFLFREPKGSLVLISRHFCPSTRLISCSSVFFFFLSFIFCAPFTFLSSPLPQSTPLFISCLTVSHPFEVSLMASPSFWLFVTSLLSIRIFNPLEMRF